MFSFFWIRYKQLSFLSLLFSLFLLVTSFYLHVPVYCISSSMLHIYSLIQSWKHLRTLTCCQCWMMMQLFSALILIAKWLPRVTSVCATAEHPTSEWEQHREVEGEIGWEEPSWTRESADSSFSSAEADGSNELAVCVCWKAKLGHSHRFLPARCYLTFSPSLVRVLTYISFLTPCWPDLPFMSASRLFF